MPLYKVWNCARSVKKTVVASDLDDLRRKGCERLSIASTNLTKVVLDNDGSEIEDTDVLLEVKGETILFLEGEEEWQPEEKMTIDRMTVNSSKNQSDSESEKMTNTSKTLVQVQQNVPVKEAECEEELTADNRSTGEANRMVLVNNKGTDLSNNSALVLEAIKNSGLPKFSPLVEKHLLENKIELVWNKFIAETATYYFAKNAEIGDSSHYRLIGEKMYLVYPCIKMEGGSHAWIEGTCNDVLYEVLLLQNVFGSLLSHASEATKRCIQFLNETQSFFTKSLSQKIRHMRHTLKIKSQMYETGKVKASIETTTPSKKFRVIPESPQPTAKTEDERKSHMVRLKEEWKKHAKNRDVGHIKMLLRETLHYRDEVLRNNPNSLMKEVVKEFCCFTDAIYVLFDFSVRYGNDKLKDVSKNLKRVVAASSHLMGRKDDAEKEEPETMIDVISYIETSTKLDRGGKKGDLHFSSIIKVLDDVEDSEIKKKLSRKEKVPPHLVVFRRNATIAAAYIVGDETTIRCQGSSITAAVLQLIALYYIFDIDYPKCYAMLLGFLQIFVVNEPFSYETSKKFKFFVKRFRPVFDKTEIEEEIEIKQS